MTLVCQLKLDASIRSPHFHEYIPELLPYFQQGMESAAIGRYPLGIKVVFLELGSLPCASAHFLVIDHILVF